MSYLETNFSGEGGEESVFSPAAPLRVNCSRFRGSFGFGRRGLAASSGAGVRGWSDVSLSGSSQIWSPEKGFWASPLMLPFCLLLERPLGTERGPAGILPYGLELRAGAVGACAAPQAGSVLNPWREEANDGRPETGSGLSPSVELPDTERERGSRARPVGATSFPYLPTLAVRACA
jgi:hypothetical protein